VPATKTSFGDGGVRLIKDPEDLEVSPFGWHGFEDGGPPTNETDGNNVFAFKGPEFVLEQSAPGQVFDYTCVLSDSLFRDDDGADDRLV